MQSKNALGNLKNRYVAVLKKCNLLNTFGSLAVAGMLTVGGTTLLADNAFALDNPLGTTITTHMDVDEQGADTDPYLRNYGTIDINGGSRGMFKSERVTGVDYEFLNAGTINFNNPFGTAIDNVYAMSIYTRDEGNDHSLINTGTIDMAIGDSSFGSIYAMSIDSNESPENELANHTLKNSGTINISLFDPIGANGAFEARYFYGMFAHTNYGNIDMENSNAITVAGGKVVLGMYVESKRGGTLSIDGEDQLSSAHKVVNSGTIDLTGTRTVRGIEVNGDKTTVINSGTITISAVSDDSAHSPQAVGIYLDRPSLESSNSSNYNATHTVENTGSITVNHTTGGVPAFEVYGSYTDYTVGNWKTTLRDWEKEKNFVFGIYEGRNLTFNDSTITLIVDGSTVAENSTGQYTLGGDPINLANMFATFNDGGADPSYHTTQDEFTSAVNIVLDQSYADGQFIAYNLVENNTVAPKLVQGIRPNTAIATDKNLDFTSVGTYTQTFDTGNSITATNTSGLIDLSFTMEDTSKFNMQGAIAGNNANSYNLNISGMDSTDSIFTIQNNVSNANEINVKTAQLTIDAENKNITAKNITVGSQSGLSVTAGTLDVSGGKLSVAADASAFETGADGTIIANASDFVTITSDLNFDTSTASVEKKLDNNGTLVLKNLNVTEMEFTAYNDLVARATDATTGFIDGGKLSLLGVDIETTNTSVDDVKDGTSLSENVFQGGTLGQTQTEEIEIGGTIGDTTNNSQSATLTGKGDAGGILVDGHYTNNAGSDTNLGSNGEESKITGEFKNSGTANIVGKVTAQNTTSTGTNNGFYVGNEAEYNTDKLTTDSNSNIKIGDPSIGKGGILRANVVSLRGGAVNIDPEFTANGIADASHTAFGSFTDGFDGKLVVGKSSSLLLGDTDETWAIETFNASGLTWGGGANEIGSALFIKAPQTLNATYGALLIDAATSTAASSLTLNTVTFGSNSLLAVDANGVGSTAALSATGGTLSVDGTSKLLIVDGKAKQEVVIVDGFTDNSAVTTSAWGIADAEQNLALSSQGLQVDSTSFDETLGKYIVTLKASFLPEDYTMMQYGTGEFIKAMGDGVGFDTDSQNTGVKLISRAIDDRYMDVSNQNLVTSTIEGSLQMASVGAMAGTALDVTKAGNRAISQQNNLSASMSENGQNGMSSTNTGSQYMQNGFGAWLTPIYGHANASGFDSGHFDSGYQSNFGGTAIGADYTINNSLRFGFGVNVGTGSSESKGDFNKTENDFDYLGGALYASYFMDNFALSADISYTALDGELEQKLPTSMGMNKLKSDVDSDVFSLGVMAEYRFNLEHFDLTPYVGLRYSHVATDGYSIHSADATGNGQVAKVASDTQDVFSIPVGVTISKEIETASGWEIAPKMELGVVANFGDLEATSKASIADVPSVSTLKMDNVDGFAFMGGLGIEVKKDNLSLNLNYHLEASEHKQNHGVFANIEYKF